MAAVSVRRSIVFWTFSFSPIQGKGALFLGPKPGFNLHPVALYREAPPERGTYLFQASVTSKGGDFTK